jgi:CBS domain-containing protein
MSASALRVQFLNSRKLAISMISGHADPYSVSLFISTIADAVSNRVLELCIAEAGKPPCRFSFIQTGSAGRKEQTLVTDQDNAIIFENTGESNLKNVKEYFLLLGKNVNNMLAATGFNLCKGGNMAGNDKWCQPISTWKKYFSDWIKMPGPNELLDVSIFFDFRHCFGDQSLTNELHDFVRYDLKANDIFFHHMATAWMPFNPSISQLSSGSTDLKKILMPLTGIIRLYSLKHGVNKFSTIERVIELYSGKNIDHTMLRETIKAWKDISSIRMTHQASYINSGTEPDNIIDLNLVTGDLRFFAGEAITTVNNLMLKAGNDFHAGPS